MKNKYNFGKSRFQKIVRCFCGSETKKRTRKNYPFGRQSKCKRTTEYYCISCGKKQ